MSIKTISSPSVLIQLLISKYASLIDVITYMDIGAQKTMVNCKILPFEAWVSHIEYFKATDDKVFQTHWISKKPVGIKFFLNYTIGPKFLAIPF